MPKTRRGRDPLSSPVHALSRPHPTTLARMRRGGLGTARTGHHARHAATVQCGLRCAPSRAPAGLGRAGCGSTRRTAGAGRAIRAAPPERQLRGVRSANEPRRLLSFRLYVFRQPWRLCARRTDRPARCKRSAPCRRDTHLGGPAGGPAGGLQSAARWVRIQFRPAPPRRCDPRWLGADKLAPPRGDGDGWTDTAITTAWRCEGRHGRGVQNGARGAG